MYLYECRRWDNEECEHWRGALIVAANSKDEALEFYKGYGDDWDGDCKEIIDMGVTLFKGDGTAYVVYNDMCR